MGLRCRYQSGVAAVYLLTWSEKESGRSLVAALVIDDQHLAVLLIEYNPVRCGTLTAQPNNFLSGVRRKSPCLRLLDVRGINPTGAEALELGSAIRICALPQPSHPHILFDAGQRVNVYFIKLLPTATSKYKFLASK